MKPNATKFEGRKLNGQTLQRKLKWLLRNETSLKDSKSAYHGTNRKKGHLQVPHSDQPLEVH